MTVATSTKTLNELYDKYKDDFEKNCSPSFHNLLWQIIVNEVMANKTICFTPVYTKTGLQIGIAHANEGGYQATNVHFTCDYEKASDILEDMNLVLFGMNEKAQTVLIGTTMALKVESDYIHPEFKR